MFHARCKVCASGDRAAIELALSRGCGIDQLAARYSISRDSIWRHGKNHLPYGLRAALAVGAQELGELDLERLKKTESESLLQTIVSYRARLLGLLTLAEEVADVSNATKVWNQLLKCWELEAKMLGELAVATRHSTTAVIYAPIHLELRTALLTALGDHPEARAKVAAALHSIESRLIEAQPA